MCICLSDAAPQGHTDLAIGEEALPLTSIWLGCRWSWPTAWQTVQPHTSGKYQNWRETSCSHCKRQQGSIGCALLLPCADLESCICQGLGCCSLRSAGRYFRVFKSCASSCEAIQHLAAAALFFQPCSFQGRPCHAETIADLHAPCAASP